MSNSRRACRVRLQPGLDVLEDRCLLSSGTVSHHPRHAIEVQALKAAQARHTPKPAAHVQKARHAPRPAAHAHKVTHTPKPNAHAHKAHSKLPKSSPPVFVYAPPPTPSPTPTPTASPAPSP